MEKFRIITPILVTISLFILSQVWIQVNDLNQKIYVHQINDDIHTPRSELVRFQADLRADFRDLQKQIIQSIREARR